MRYNLLRGEPMIFEYGGRQMYYERQGAGKPLLLLHGWGGKIESWLPVTRDFSKAREVIAVDFPGFGRSPEPDAPWSVTEYMELIAAFLRQLGMEGADIIAHSFGARVSILLSATYPELAGKLVLTGAAGLIPKPSNKRKARSLAYRALKGMAESALSRALLGEVRVAVFREALIQKFGSRDYRALSPGMRPTFNRVIHQDLAPCLPKIKSPALLIWGAKDVETPLWMGKVMEKEIPDAGLIVFEDAGHFAYLERYADFRTIVLKFLEESNA
jgi:pimeloyl-ACP methyl ester carboxylesterase